MKRLVLGKDWVTKRMKALRFHLTDLPGRVISHARRLTIRLGAGAEALATMVTAPSDHPGAGMWTSWMVRECHLHNAAPPIAGNPLGVPMRFHARVVSWRLAWAA